MADETKKEGERLAGSVPFKRYLLFCGPVFDEDQADEITDEQAMALGQACAGWEAYLGSHEDYRVLLDQVAQFADNMWWQIVDFPYRAIIFSSYDERRRH